MNRILKNPLFYINIILLVLVFAVVYARVSHAKFISLIKEALAAGPIRGGGTIDFLARFAGAANPSDTIGDSIIFDDGTKIGIGTTNPGAKLDVTDGSGQCCASQTPNISLSQASNTNGKMSWLQFHNAGEAEAYIRLAGGGTGLRAGQRRLEIGDSQGVLTGLTVTGNVGVGTTNPGIARLNITNQGDGVGVYIGDAGRAPYGQAMLEINPPGAATHIWAQEGTTRVFSVAAGGAVYAANIVQGMRFIDDDATYWADLNAGANLNGRWTFNGVTHAKGGLVIPCGVPSSENGAMWLESC